MPKDKNNQLKPCPCGETPKKLVISEGATGTYAWVSGDCCGDWNIEFRTNHEYIDTERCKELAKAAWNSVGRGKYILFLGNTSSTKEQDAI